jgi:hypothetical protein
MKKAPTREQRLNQNLGGTDNSTSPKIPKGFNHLRTLHELASIWVERGYYPDTGYAYKALIEGVIE